MYRGAHKNCLRHCGNGNRIHHRTVRKSHSVPIIDVCPTVAQSRRKLSVASTLTSYPGKTTDDNKGGSDEIDESFEVKPAVVPKVDIGKARPLSNKVRKKYAIPNDSEDESEKEDDGKYHKFIGESAKGGVTEKVIDLSVVGLHFFKFKTFAI